MEQPELTWNKLPWLVRFENLKMTFRRDNHEVIYDDLAICEGDFVILSGNNGSGKTSLLSAINNFNYHHEDEKFEREGDIYVHFPDFDDDTSIFEYEDDERTRLRRYIVYIKQEDQFEDGMSAYGNMMREFKSDINALDISHKEKKEKILEAKGLIEYYFNNYFIKAKHAKKRKSKVLSKKTNKPSKIKEYSIKDFKKSTANSFSGGEKKLISIMQGFIKAELMKSKFIMMDEPLNNFDSENKRIVNNMIDDLRHKEGGDKIAFLVITHCQIFLGINKHLAIESDDQGQFYGKLYEIKGKENFMPCLINGDYKISKNKYALRKEAKDE